MLTHMSSIALAQASHPAPFNGNFYVVAATVIPVLYLAIALQKGHWAEYLETATRKAGGSTLLGFQLLPQPEGFVANLKWWRDISNYLGALIWMLATALSLMYGMIGEVLAVLFLWNQHVPSGPYWSRLGVLWPLVGLAVVAGTGAAQQWMKPVSEAMKRAERAPIIYQVDPDSGRLTRVWGEDPPEEDTEA
jgi:hypothetical protein